jgi:hypothetical protein
MSVVKGIFLLARAHCVVEQDAVVCLLYLFYVGGYPNPYGTG